MVLGFHGSINLNFLNILVWKTFYFSKEVLSAPNGPGPRAHLFVGQFLPLACSSPGFFNVSFVGGTALQISAFLGVC